MLSFNEGERGSKFSGRGHNSLPSVHTLDLTPWWFQFHSRFFLVETKLNIEILAPSTKSRCFLTKNEKLQKLKHRIFKEVLGASSKICLDIFEHYCVLNLPGSFFTVNLGLFWVKIERRDLFSVLKISIFSFTKLPDRFIVQFVIKVDQKFFEETKHLSKSPVIHPPCS